MIDDEDIVYKYSFTLESGEIKHIQLCLDIKSLNILSPPPAENLPDWTRLDCNQCPNCPLNIKEHPYCPIAVNMSTLADSFGEFPSYHKSKVCVQTNWRVFVKHTDIQTALSSILGIYMVASGCPIMDKLRPMVRFHLPFATLVETQYRAISMYLAAQYLRYKKGKTPDWDLTGLLKMYEEIHKVNMAFSNRLTNIGHCDANRNALVILDNCAALINLNFQVDKQIPSELEDIFKPFTDAP